MVLLRDLHHTTGTNWEIKIRASMVASSRWTYRMWSQDAAAHALQNASCASDAGLPALGWKFFINQYRSDATNSQIWQASKLHVTELSSWYTPFAIEEDADPELAMQQVEARSMFGDLQVVRDGTGLGTLAIIRKALRSIGGVAGGGIREGITDIKADDIMPSMDGARILQHRRAQVPCAILMMRQWSDQMWRVLLLTLHWLCEAMTIIFIVLLVGGHWLLESAVLRPHLGTLCRGLRQLYLPLAVLLRPPTTHMEMAVALVSVPVLY